MKQLKIRKDLWELILKGEKKYEFRKLSKGLETGTYEFVSIEKELYCKTCNGNNIGIQFIDVDFCIDCSGNYTEISLRPNEIFGTAKLRPIAVNPQISGHGSKYRFYTSISNTLGYSEMCVVDKGTYDFVKENYIDKGIDFIAWELSEVK